MFLNCYYWRDSELLLWIELGVWSGCYLEVLMEMVSFLLKTKYFVWFLKVDLFLFYRIVFFEL